MGWLATVLDNKSVSAFVGAFSAFVLVFATDWRRERRKVRNIKSEVEVNQVIARNKLVTARNNRSDIRDHNRITAAPTLKFNTSIIRSLAADVLSRLTIDQRRAIDALCYRMEAIDGLFDEVATQALRFRPPSDLSNEQRLELGKSILDTYADIIVNLRILDEMAGNYIAGHYTEIVTKGYDRAKYEE